MLEAAHHVRDGVGLADVGEKLVATSPAMSTNSTTAGTTFCGCAISAITSRRRSGTSTMPTFGSMVQKG
jgi:hypothetical protein